MLDVLGQSLGRARAGLRSLPVLWTRNGSDQLARAKKAFWASALLEKLAETDGQTPDSEVWKFKALPLEHSRSSSSSVPYFCSPCSLPAARQPSHEQVSPAPYPNNSTATLDKKSPTPDGDVQVRGLGSNPLHQLNGLIYFGLIKEGATIWACYSETSSASAAPCPASLRRLGRSLRAASSPSERQ
jgi:hypothetical protein